MMNKVIWPIYKMKVQMDIQICNQWVTYKELTVKFLIQVMEKFISYTHNLIGKQVLNILMVMILLMLLLPFKEVKCQGLRLNDWIPIY